MKEYQLTEADHHHLHHTVVKSHKSIGIQVSVMDKLITSSFVMFYRFVDRINKTKFDPSLIFVTPPFGYTHYTFVHTVQSSDSVRNRTEMRNAKLKIRSGAILNFTHGTYTLSATET